MASARPPEGVCPGPRQEEFNGLSFEDRNLVSACNTCHKKPGLGPPAGVKQDIEWLSPSVPTGVYLNQGKYMHWEGAGEASYRGRDRSVSEQTRTSLGRDKHCMICYCL